LPVCVYKFSSHYLNNIIFIDNSLGPLARESHCITSLRKVKLVSHFQHGSQSIPFRDLSVFSCEQVDKICTLSSLPALRFLSVQASAISIDRGAHFALLHLPTLLFIAFHFLLLSLSLFLSFSFIRPFYHPCNFNLIFLLFPSLS